VGDTVKVCTGQGTAGQPHGVRVGPLAAFLRIPVFVDNGAKTLGQAEMWAASNPHVDIPDEYSEGAAPAPPA
jgi:predicted NBD/HSP70 family sugar kinase